MFFPLLLMLYYTVSKQTVLMVSTVLSFLISINESDNRGQPQDGLKLDLDVDSSCFSVSVELKNVAGLAFDRGICRSYLENDTYHALVCQEGLMLVYGRLLYYSLY